MVELNERAQARVNEIRQKNKEKSLKKIEELRQGHIKNGKSLSKDKKNKKEEHDGTQDVDMNSDDEDKHTKKQFVNKNKVDSQKMKNKRA